MATQLVHTNQTINLFKNSSLHYTASGGEIRYAAVECAALGVFLLRLDPHLPHMTSCPNTQIANVCFL